MENKLINILSQSDLFRNIKPVEIEFLLSNYTYTIKSYTKKDVFALAKDKVNFLMIVLEGSLIARMVSDSGKYVQIDRIKAGRAIAPAIIFATDNVFPVNVIPDENTEVLFMRKEIFLKAMQKNETLLLNFIEIVSNINGFLSKKIHTLSLKSIRGKLAEYILQLSAEQNNSDIVMLHLTRQELADKFAVARQAISRSLSELESEGLIEVDAKRIRIKDCIRLKNEE